MVNGYANGWLIDSRNLPQKDKYTIYIQIDPQKYFWYGWSVTLVSLVIVIFILTFSIKKDHEKN